MKGVNRLRLSLAASTEGERLGESGIAYRLLDGGEASERDADLLALAGEVHGNAGDPAAPSAAELETTIPDQVA